MAGISADVVPFQLKNDGRYDMWNPDCRSTGDAAETMPATTAAAGRRMPNKHDRGQPQQPGHHGDREVGDALLVRRVEHAADARDRRGQREHTELHPQHGHAGGVRRDLRRPRRHDGATPRRSAQVVDQEHHDPDEQQHEHREGLVVVHVEGADDRAGDAPARLQVAQPVPLEEHLVAEERKGERRQRERQASQPQRGQRHDAAQRDGGGDGHDDGGEERPLVPVDRASRS